MKRPRTSPLSHDAYVPLFYALVLSVLFTSNAYAGTAMADVLCLVVGWMQGNLGSGLATIGVSVVGVGAIFGKVSWGLAITVGIGVTLMFKAAAILYGVGINVASC